MCDFCNSRKKGLDKMTDREGKEKGAGGYPRKTRKPEGPAAQALESLVQLLIVFGRDLMDPEVRVEAAGDDFVANLTDFLRRYGNG